MLVQSVVLLYLVELRHECCGTSASEVYEDGGDKGKEAHLLWAERPIPQVFWAKVESNFDVLLVTGEDKS